MFSGICNHIILLIWEVKGCRWVEFLVFQVWKRNAVGQMPDCTHRISINMEHSGRRLRSYETSAENQLFSKTEISLEVRRQGDCLQSRDSPCQKGRVDSSELQYKCSHEIHAHTCFNPPGMHIKVVMNL